MRLSPVCVSTWTVATTTGTFQHMSVMRDKILGGNIDHPEEQHTDLNTERGALQVIRLSVKDCTYKPHTSPSVQIKLTDPRKCRSQKSPHNALEGTVELMFINMRDMSRDRQTIPSCGQGLGNPSHTLVLNFLDLLNTLLWLLVQSCQYYQSTWCLLAVKG